MEGRADGPADGRRDSVALRDGRRRAVRPGRGDHGAAGGAGGAAQPAGRPRDAAAAGRGEDAPGGLCVRERGLAGGARPVRRRGGGGADTVRRLTTVVAVLVLV